MINKQLFIEMWGNTFMANWLCCFLSNRNISYQRWFADRFSPHYLQYSPLCSRHSVVSDKHAIICLDCILKIGSWLSVETNDCVLSSDKQSILHFVTSLGAPLRLTSFFGGVKQYFAVDLIDSVCIFTI